MCYFRYSPVLREGLVAIDDAVVAWKSLRLNPGGVLVSPVQNTHWRPDREMRSSRAPVHGRNVGIYAFRDRRSAWQYGSAGTDATVKLLLWGEVIAYGARGSRRAGFMAQRAEIHEIHLPSGLRAGALRDTTDQAVELLVENWRGHGVKITRVHGRSRVTLLSAREPMAVAA